MSRDIVDTGLSMRGWSGWDTGAEAGQLLGPTAHGLEGERNDGRSHGRQDRVPATSHERADTEHGQLSAYGETCRDVNCESCRCLDGKRVGLPQLLVPTPEG